MARRKHLQSLYLDPEKALSLDALAGQTRIPKAVLLREAVDDLLAKYQIVDGQSRRNVPANVRRDARRRIGGQLAAPR